MRLRYFIRVTVTRHYTSGNMIKEEEFLVQKTDTAPEINNTIKMEVGIEECLHIEFEYDKQKYHLRDIIIGKVYFLLVRIKIKHMELAIVRREVTRPRAACPLSRASRGSLAPNRLTARAIRAPRRRRRARGRSNTTRARP